MFYAVDITVYHNGFHGDLNETFFVGEVDEGAKKLVQTTYECLMQAIDSGRHRTFMFFIFTVGIVVISTIKPFQVWSCLTIKTLKLHKDVVWNK